MASEKRKDERMRRGTRKTRGRMVRGRAGVYDKHDSAVLYAKTTSTARAARPRRFHVIYGHVSDIFQRCKDKMQNIFVIVVRQ